MEWSDTDPYRYLRQHRPDLLRAGVEVGLAVTCGRKRLEGESEADYVQHLAARAESRAMSALAALLKESDRE